MAGENGVALGARRDNYDGTYEIELFVEKGKEQFPFLNYTCLVRKPIKMPELK